MAATYIATATAVTWSTSNKVFFSIFNGSGSGKIVKIKRVWVLNAQASAATGIVQTFGLYKITTDTSGGSPTTITATKYDTNSADVPAQITIKTANTTNGTSSLLYQQIFSGDEPAVSTFTMDELEAIPNLMLVWDVGYGNTSIQPLTLRADQGFSIYNAGVASSAGNIDINVEFTLE